LAPTRAELSIEFRLNRNEKNHEVHAI